jgi:hypothetical protein
MQITISKVASGRSINVTKNLQFQTPQDEISILSAPGVVEEGTEFPGIPGVVATSVTLTPVDSKLWTMTVVYSPRKYDYATPGAIPKPWEEPARITRDPLPDVVRVQDKCYNDEDIKGDPTTPILLPTGTAFANPPLVPVGASRITITWNVQYSQVNDSVFSDCEYTCNSLDLTIDGRLYKAGTLYMELCYNNTAYTSDGTKYKTCVAKILHNPDGHAFKPLLMDYKAFFMVEIGEDTERQLQPIKLKNGRWGHFIGDKEAKPVTEPVPIDFMGDLITDNPDEVKNLKASYGNFDCFYKTTWADLKIPETKAIIEK